MHPKDVKSVYLMGIGGIAMGTLATMLKAKGLQVLGSDQNLYPPMSTHLEHLHIPLCQGYDAKHLETHQPDLVIIGNVIRRENPEAQYVLEHEIPYLSMPEAIERFFLTSQQSLVIAGTHGKSTTSALLSWVLDRAGLDPGALIGGFVKNWQRSFRLGQGPYMVLEGDEYDTAFFDKGPKFLHYRPHFGVITSIEYDHADIFADFAAVLKAFRGFVSKIQPRGQLLINGDDVHCCELADECAGRVLTYGEGEHADYRLVEARYPAGEVRFTYQNPQGVESSMVSRLAGRHNLSNTLAVVAVASELGVAKEQIQAALLSFQGVTRRQDVLGEARGVLVVDDFAHHPTAVKATLQAIRLFYPDRRLLALFEPRSNSSRRNIFHDEYAAAFDAADVICIKQPPDLGNIPVEERLDARRLAQDISHRHRTAYAFEDTAALLAFLLAECRPGDLALVMSNGSFDGLPHRLLDALRQRKTIGVAVHRK
jgi:UDP-N-acetylmuramate: L-alanyl-gamma-D-glutamyl-meso-diaminopimelate ligase